MKAHYRTRDGRLTFEIDGEQPKDLFKKVASLQEVFEEPRCGCCGGTEFRYVVRVVDDNEYFELRCMNKDCRAKLEFGQNKKGGGLFPKRKNKEGEGYLPNHGWQKWEGNKPAAA